MIIVNNMSDSFELSTVVVARLAYHLQFFYWQVSNYAIVLIDIFLYIHDLCQCDIML